MVAVASKATNNDDERSILEVWKHVALSKTGMPRLMTRIDGITQ